MSRALRESDPARLSQLVYRVEDAVLARTIELKVGRELADRNETQAIAACLRDLLWIKSHRLNWPEIGESDASERSSWSPGAKMHWKEVFSESLREASRDRLRPDVLKAGLPAAEIAILNRGMELGSASLGASERTELVAAANKITEISKQKLGYSSL
jgi:hypothetical protein